MTTEELKQIVEAALSQRGIKRNSGRYQDYEQGKAVLLWDLASLQLMPHGYVHALKVLADWVGV